MPETQPLISILIGAYKPKFFAECIESALSQTWQNFELIVGDDCPTTEIQEMTATYAAQDPRVKYYRNPQNIGSRENFIKLYQMAQGQLIKFLCDDDRLHPLCCERMAACLADYPDVTLVTSHRRFIDSEGREPPELGVARRPGAEDCRIPGPAVANRMSRRKINFIGEPTTVMFRKRDMDDNRPDIFSYAGEPHLTNGDVVMWLHLLAKGDAIFLVEPMSDFRRHPDQEQLYEFTRIEAPKVWDRLLAATARTGLLRPDGTTDMPIQPLGSLRPWWTPEVKAAVKRAEDALEAGDIETGLAALDQARTLAPSESWIYVLQGGLKLVVGDPLGALMAYRHAAALSPDHPRILTNLASALLAVGRPSERETAGQLALLAARLCPDDPDAKGLLAELTGTLSAAAPAAAPPAP